MEDDHKKHDLGERSLDFAAEIVRFCRKLDRSQGVNRKLTGQLLRSGTSIGANIAEGLGSQSKADFLTKYSIACKEARETLYWLKLFQKSSVTDLSAIAPLTDECNQLVAILTTIVKKLKARPK